MAIQPIRQGGPSRRAVHPPDRVSWYFTAKLEGSPRPSRLSTNVITVYTSPPCTPSRRSWSSHSGPPYPLFPSVLGIHLCPLYPDSSRQIWTNGSTVFVLPRPISVWKKKLYWKDLLFYLDCYVWYPSMSLAGSRRVYYQVKGPGLISWNW